MVGGAYVGLFVQIYIPLCLSTGICPATSIGVGTGGARGACALPPNILGGGGNNYLATYSSQAYAISRSSLDRLTNIFKKLRSYATMTYLQVTKSFETFYARHFCL